MRNLATIIDAYADFLDLALGKDHTSHHLVTKLPGQETHRRADLEAGKLAAALRSDQPRPRCGARGPGSSRHRRAHCRSHTRRAGLQTLPHNA